MLDNTMTKQGPVLHQTKHPNFLLKHYLFAPCRRRNHGKGEQLLDLA
jgi:hypothetical protein